jgi:AcrR family transcriptional regulator
MKRPSPGRPPTKPRRRQILDAALNCFLEQGFESTTIEQIRQASGASHGSIYHHFGNKEAIALALYTEGMHEYQADILARLAGQTTTRGGIRAVISGHLEWTAAHPDRALFLTRVGMADASKEASAHIAEVNQEFFRAVHDWLRPFITAGEIILVPAVLYVPLILGPTTHFARHWLAHRMALDMSEVAETFATIAWKSLTTVPEHGRDGPRRRRATEGP